MKGGTPETDFLWADVPDGVSLVKYIGSEEDIVIPETAGGKPVTEIAPWAFWNCLQAKKVKIGSRVTRIRQRAFWFCTELIFLELPAGVSEIETAAFDECVQLQSFTLDPENQKYACRDGVLFSRDMKKAGPLPGGKTGTLYGTGRNADHWGRSVPRMRFSGSRDPAGGAGRDRRPGILQLLQFDGTHSAEKPKSHREQRIYRLQPGGETGHPGRSRPCGRGRFFMDKQSGRDLV
ncbi:MAG: leucine-rich repeat protein [Verrucomicrobia bacterium]|nr:leucine-rich repeat protein [Verrucomicrobiota bacterium]